MSTRRVWVDADACPRPVREILFRAAERRRVLVTLVANCRLHWPSSPYVRCIQVGQGSDRADHMILQRLAAGDLVVTADIPLAAAAVERGALALGPRGELYAPENVRTRLSERDFDTGLRRAGVDTGGAAVFSARDRRNFANQLDRLLSDAQAPGPRAAAGAP